MRYSLIVFVTLFTCCVSTTPTGSSVLINDVTINVEIADSPSEWQTGLMFRDSLEEGSGMLFVFPDSRVRSFWMKNTLIPLDIIFIDENSIIIDIQQTEPCKTDPCPSYISNGRAMFALEIRKGFTDTHGIRVGDMVEFLE